MRRWWDDCLLADRLARSSACIRREPGSPWRSRIRLFLGTAVLAAVCNGAALSTDVSRYLTKNDVYAILLGYRQVPNLLIDSGRWWHGAWIQAGIPVLRPLTSYLYWAECWLGLHAGWRWCGLVGLLLLALEAQVAAALAARLTGSRATGAVALLFVVCQASLIAHSGDDWLLWFPCHQELLIATWLMATLYWLDRWAEDPRPADLGGLWLCAVAALLTKETAFIVPAMAAVLAFRARRWGPAAQRRAWQQVALLSAWVAVVVVWRELVIALPRNPTLQSEQPRVKLGLYLFHPFAMFLAVYEYWLPGLAVLVLAWAAWLVRCAPAWLRRHPVLVLLATLAALSLYLSLVGPGLVISMARVLDPTSATPLFLLQMLVLEAGLGLLWIYRRDEPTLAVYALLVLAYVPNIDLIGWHYDLVPWVFRALQWALVVRLAVRLLREGPPWALPARAQVTSAGRG